MQAIHVAGECLARGDNSGSLAMLAAMRRASRGSIGGRPLAIQLK